LRFAVVKQSTPSMNDVAPTNAVDCRYMSVGDTSDLVVTYDDHYIVMYPLDGTKCEPDHSTTCRESHWR
jgi:hypothetical protein